MRGAPARTCKLVSSPVALSVAAAASVALAVLAWVDDEEALFSVGVGGALVAPFVTSTRIGQRRSRCSSTATSCSAADSLRFAAERGGRR